MDCKRASTQEAWGDLVSLYREISEDVEANPLIEETLYADDKPVETTRRPRRPLITWDYEQGKPIRIREATSIWEVAELAVNGDITLGEGLLWCDTYGASIEKFEELYTEIKCDRLFLHQHHHLTEPWYHRLVEFINRAIEIFWKFITEELL